MPYKNEENVTIGVLDLATIRLYAICDDNRKLLSVFLNPTPRNLVERPISHGISIFAWNINLSVEPVTAPVNEPLAAIGHINFCPGGIYERSSVTSNLNFPATLEQRYYSQL